MSCTFLLLQFIFSMGCIWIYKLMWAISDDYYCSNLVCSIWTVDLAYLLQKFSVRFSYYTVTFGANPNYSGETYYKVICVCTICIFVMILCQYYWVLLVCKLRRECLVSMLVYCCKLCTMTCIFYVVG